MTFSVSPPLCNWTTASGSASARGAAYRSPSPVGDCDTNGFPRRIHTEMRRIAVGMSTRVVSTISPLSMLV